MKPIVVINKIDRPEARCEEVIDQILNLFIDLEANDKQLDFPIIYASAKQGIAQNDLSELSSNMKPLFDMILKEVPPPTGSRDDGLQLLISSVDYDPYVGRIGIGKIIRGTIKKTKKSYYAPQKQKRSLSDQQIICF